MVDRSRGNARRARLVVGAVALLPFLLSALVGLIMGAPVVGATVGLVLGVLAAVVFVRTATARILRAVDARPLAVGEHARLVNLLDGLCLTSGVPTPGIRIVDSEVPDAVVVGTSPRSAVVVVTSGFLERLGRIELEGVVAHLLIRIRHDDIAPATLVAGLGPFTDAVARRLLPDDRILAADVDACQLTRYPPGLIGALEAVGRAGAAVTAASATPATTSIVTSTGRPLPAHLCLAPAGNAPTSHPPLDERIALLREL